MKKRNAPLATPLSEPFCHTALSFLGLPGTWEKDRGRMFKKPCLFSHFVSKLILKGGLSETPYFFLFILTTTPQPKWPRIWFLPHCWSSAPKGKGWSSKLVLK